ncbi:MAG: FapA family protein [Spirochaetaceae bacterium]|nr:FapA family protein [Spirochaetaceae bacterium]
MLDFAAFQQAIKGKLDEDRAIQVIDAEGPNLEAAVAEAATLLGVPLRHLEYEVVLQKTSFLGIGENICKIRAFERPDIKKAALEAFDEIDELEEIDNLELLEDKNGDVFVQRRATGVYIKVTLPVGAGNRASVSDATRALAAYGIKDYDMNAVKAAVKAAAAQYTRIADYKNSIMNDTTVTVEITDSEMRVYMLVNPPLPEGCDITYEQYVEVLKQYSVVYGINDTFLQDFADRPVYRQRVCVAQGKKAIDGIDAYLEYYFETDQSKVRIVENQRTGQVNLKELNLIQNVTKNQKLAKLIDAEEGVDGSTVTGKILPSRSGRDVAIQLGKNVHFDEDQHTVLADINGQVVFANGKINVEMIYVVDGSVGPKTGNITFLGNIVINGNVEEGFSVRAAGNIEVHGIINKAAIDAGGDLIVNGGIIGKEGTAVRSEGNIWAKFIENAIVDSGDSVIVTDGIVNSTMCVSKKIVCQGKRAAVLGGRLRAGEEISAKQLGSSSGNTPTLCEVGYDPKTAIKIEELTAREEQLQKEFDDIQLNFQTLTNIKKQRGSLPEDKETFLNELVVKRNETSKLIKAASEELTKLKEVLEAMQTQGRVTATGKVYPGVVIVIRDQRETIRSEYKSSVFVLENNFVRAIAYADPKDKDKKGLKK